jgi:hypothetical protein
VNVLSQRGVLNLEEVYVIILEESTEIGEPPKDAPVF